METFLCQLSKDLKYNIFVVAQPKFGFYYISEVGARGLLNFGEKAFGPSKLGKFDVV